MQHTLTPFLIRAPSKTEGWGGAERNRKREGAALCLGGRGVRKRRATCCIDFLAGLQCPTSHGGFRLG